MTGLVSIALAPLASMLLASATPPAATAQFEVAFQHKLSTNFGPLPLMGAALSWDPMHREMYVTGEGAVRVFNDAGMEVFTFAEDPEVGAIYRIAALEDGDLLAQAYREGRFALLRLNFRGELIKEIAPGGVPAGYEGALARGFMRYQGGRIYLGDLAAMRVLVLDLKGAVIASWDLAEKLDEAQNRESLGVRGFNVDSQGNILFTVQPLFKAFVLSPAGELHAFGVKGSAPGKFNVVSGIARDDAGNYYVADILKSVVIVFDANFQFVREFGYRGTADGNLAAPEDLEVGAGKLYVSQHARRGVSVFRIAQQ